MAVRLSNGWARYIVVDGSRTAAVPQVKALRRARSLETAIRVIVPTEGVGQRARGQLFSAATAFERGVLSTSERRRLQHWMSGYSLCRGNTAIAANINLNRYIAAYPGLLC